MFNKRIPLRRWMPRASLTLLALLLSFAVHNASAQTATAQTASAASTYYLSPTGNDGRDGTSEATAWATFDRAWQALNPGDTLVVMDGVYTQVMHPSGRNGEPGKPITIKAQHDGKAVVQGDGTTAVLQLGDNWPGDIGSYYTVEGLVVRNGSDAVVRIRAHDVILRRVSAYDADPNSNSAVITVWSNPANVLLEDVVAGGIGRKMIFVFMSSNVTVRRGFAQWSRWDGREFCAAGWPAGNGINVYNSQNVTVENGFSIGPVFDRGIGVTANADDVYSPGLKILGSIGIGAGLNPDGTPYRYIPPSLATLPSNCKYPQESEIEYFPANRAGIGFWGQGNIEKPLVRDVLGAGNAQMGFASAKPYGIGVTGGTLDHATLLDNGKYAVKDEVGNQGTFAGFTVTNSNIPGYQNGEGARLLTRYIDGNMTDQPLWPWPMEDRIKAELGISPTDTAAKYIPGIR